MNDSTTEGGGEQSTDDFECLYCMDEGSIKRRYGTAGPGPAKIVKSRPCPMCSEGDRDV